MDCNMVPSLTGSMATLSPSLSLWWADGWLSGPPLPPGDEGVSIWGHGHRVDLGEKKVSIEWEVSRGSIAGRPRAIPSWDAPGSVPWEPSDYAVDVYLTDSVGSVFSYDPAKFLGFGRFETEHELHASDHFPVPFDSYTFQAFVFAISPVSNRSVDIARFTVPSSPDGFTVYSTDTGVEKQLTYNTGSGPTTVEVKSRLLTVVIRYSTLTLTLTACMFAANWVLTFGSLYVVFSATTEGRVTWSAFVLHGAVALVILSIRKLYLCPPFFGVYIETVGFFSQLTIISFSSIALLRSLVVSPKVTGRSSSAVQKG